MGRARRETTEPVFRSPAGLGVSAPPPLHQNSTWNPICTPNNKNSSPYSNAREPDDGAFFRSGPARRTATRRLSDAEPESDTELRPDDETFSGQAPTRRGAAGRWKDAGHWPLSQTGTASMTKPLTERQEKFLDAFRTYGIVLIAARKAGVSHELHYNAMRVSETYRQAFAAIQQQHALGLEEQAREIAVNGIPEPVYYGRKLVAFKRKHSDSLLIRLLEANAPEKFGRPKAPARRRRRPDGGRNFQTGLARILAERRTQPRSDRSTWKRLRRTGPPPGQPCLPTAEARWDELRKLARQHARPKTAPPAAEAEPSKSPRHWRDLRRGRIKGPTRPVAHQFLDGSLDGSASGEGRGQPLHPNSPTHTPPSQTPTIGVAASFAQAIDPRRPGPAGRWQKKRGRPFGLPLSHFTSAKNLRTRGPAERPPASRSESGTANSSRSRDPACGRT